MPRSALVCALLTGAALALGGGCRGDGTSAPGATPADAPSAASTALVNDGMAAGAADAVAPFATAALPLTAARAPATPRRRRGRR